MPTPPAPYPPEISVAKFEKTLRSALSDQGSQHLVAAPSERIPQNQWGVETSFRAHL